MDAQLEKEIAGMRIRAAGLNQRCMTLIAAVDLLHEYVQLTGQQAKLVENLCFKLKIYEDKSAEPAGGPVRETPPTTTG